VIAAPFVCSDSSTALPISFDIRRKARSRRVRVTGFVRRSRTRRRIQNDGKWPCVPHTDTILHLQLNPRHAVDAVTRHILLSQRPGRFNRLLQVPEEERRVGAADDAVVARQSDHHSLFDAHARQSFGQVDYLRFRRSYS
jgi:hypothetical protein